MYHFKNTHSGYEYSSYWLSWILQWERKNKRMKIKFEIDKKYLLHVGRLIEDHGIEIILDVFKIIKPKWAHCRRPNIVYQYTYTTY